MGMQSKSTEAQERERDLRENPRSTARRWGWGSYWEFPGGLLLDIGEAVQGEGPGSGAVIYPWALDRYERVLRLRPATAAVLRRLLKHVWEWDGEAYCSQRLMSLECMLDRSSIARHLDRLEQLHYIRRVGQWKRGWDSRIHFDVKGLYAALALAIACDPDSALSRKNNSTLPIEQAKKATFYKDERGEPLKFDLDWHALDALVLHGWEWVEAEWSQDAEPE